MSARSFERLRCARNWLRARVICMTAQKNASAVVALWGNADAELQPLVRRMKEIASGRRQPINQPQGVQ